MKIKKYFLILFFILISPNKIFSIELKTWTPPFISENGIKSPFINDPIVLRPMIHKPTEYEKAPYNFWYENRAFYHVHGLSPSNLELRHQHFHNNLDNFIMGNFITDPPSTGLNDFNEESEMSNKQTPEISPSSAPPAELRQFSITNFKILFIHNRIKY
uniref:Uncharacterized protein n=1 Tax=Meloidogyne enterolobii TaxID=390850 RepID=A0A6V7V8U8_MELEN|nr:unnamed protein product [Meloidogyne enterolobii]